MNKTFKYIFIVAGAIVALAACNRVEAPAPEGPDAPAGAEGREVVLKAVAPGATKVHMDGFNVLWDADDIISIADGPNPNYWYSNSPFVCTSLEGNTATFSGMLEWWQSGPLSAFYPGNPDVVFTEEGNVEMWRSSSQIIPAGAYLDRDQMWMTAVGTDELYFQPVVGALKFRVAQENITQLEFTFEGAPQGEAMVEISDLDSNPQVSLGIQPTMPVCTVTVTPYDDGNSLASFETGKDYVVTLLPGSATKVKVAATRRTNCITYIATEYSRLQSSRALDIAPGKMNSFGTLNFTKWFDDPIEDVEFPEADDEIYLIWSDSENFYCEKPYSAYSLTTPGTVYPNFGACSANESVATVSGMTIVPTGIGETDITLWYPANANGPEMAMDSKVYHVIVDRAFAGGLFYVFDDYKFSDTDPQLVPAAWLTGPSVLCTDYESDWPYYDLLNQFYDGRQIQVPSVVSIAGSQFRVAGTIKYAFLNTTPVSIEFENGPEDFGGETFSCCTARRILLPKTLRKVHSFGMIYNQYAEIIFNDQSLTNGYLTIDDNGIYSDVDFFFANRLNTHIVVPEGIKTVCNGAITFTDCSSLELPPSVQDVSLWNFISVSVTGRTQYTAGNPLQQLIVSSDVEAFKRCMRYSLPEPENTMWMYDVARESILDHTTLVVRYPRGNAQFLADWRAYVAGFQPSRYWFKDVVFVPADQNSGSIKPFDPDGDYTDWQ